MNPQNQYPAPGTPQQPSGTPQPGGTPPNPGPAPALATPQPQQPQPASQPSLSTPGARQTGQLGEPRVSPPSKRENVREIFSTIGVLLAALAVAFSLIAWVFQSYQVEGPSMNNTLHNNDRLIVWKVPRTIARVTNHDWIPKRSEIIIFVEGGLSQFGQEDSKQLIKRVIALPGERVVLENSKLTVYNKEHPEGFEPDKLGGYKIIPEQNDVHNIDITLADNQIFVCGDNRPDSLDSRTFGPINADQVVGRLALRLLPVSQIQKFD